MVSPHILCLLPHHLIMFAKVPAQGVCSVIDYCVPCATQDRFNDVRV